MHKKLQSHISSDITIPWSGAFPKTISQGFRTWKHADSTLNNEYGFKKIMQSIFLLMRKMYTHPGTHIRLRSIDGCT